MLTNTFAGTPLTIDQFIDCSERYQWLPHCWVI